MEKQETARQMMKALLEKMGVRAEVEGSADEETIHLQIKGDQEGILIGKHGRTLESLQLIMSRMINRKTETPVRIILDINNYRKRRTEDITDMARRLEEQVRQTGQSVTIGPFNAHERRIIHMTLKENPSLRTESLGEGEIKKMRISTVKKEEEERTSR